MSHFGRSGPPDIKDTHSLLVLNISFRTSADDLYPRFAKYGKVVDVFIPRDKRTGDSRGFAFVRYKYAEEAQEAVDHLDGRRVDGRDIMVQFAKYGPTGESIKKGKVSEMVSRTRVGSRSRSPRPRYRGDYHGRDYKRHSRSRSRDRYDRDKYQGRQRDYRPRSRSRSDSPDHSRHQTRNRVDDRPQRSSRSFDSGSSAHQGSPYQSPSPHRSRSKSPKVHCDERSPDQRRAREENSPPGSPAYHEHERSPLSISPSPHHGRKSSISPHRHHDERSSLSISPRRHHNRSPRDSDAQD